MQNKTPRRIVLFFVLGLLCGRVAGATPVMFTDRAAFDAAVSGFTGINTLDFDSLPVGDLGSSPTVQGVTFGFNTDGFNPKVVGALLQTTSGPTSLGTMGDNTFVAGDSFTMSFAPTQAVGLYIIAADLISAGDFTLSTAGGSVSNAAGFDSAFPLQLSDGGKVFFVGLVDSDPFTTATLSSAGLPADFVFNVDDITGQFDPSTPPTTNAVPEPATLALVASGLAAAWRSRRKDSSA
jgi:hypothetical protein